jgi:aspartate/methionine/tyrosine aminotransferase
MSSVAVVGDAKVAVAPGETFGSNGAGAIRISLAASEETIDEGMRRIASVVQTATSV